MNDVFRPLSPDDAQQEKVDLLPDEKETGQPYGVAALFVGMATLLLVRGLLRGADEAILPKALVWGWSIALTAGLFAYSTFAVIRPKIHLLTLCILGAELGMLYGFPATGLFVSVWHDVNQLATLIRWLVLSGIVGLFVARGLTVERNPQPVTLISTLLAFVMVSLWFMYNPHL